MSIEISFEPWRPFRARLNEQAIRGWLKKVADKSEQAFKRGMKSGSSDNRSKHGEYPAMQSGRLRGTIKTEVKAMEMTIGTSTHYSRYLRYGTRKMDDRNMSDEALEAGLRGAGRMAKWVEWTRS